MLLIRIRCCNVWGRDEGSECSAPWCFRRTLWRFGLNKSVETYKKGSSWNEILKACVLAPIANPVSKYRTASMLELDYGILIALEKIYRMTDRLVASESNITQPDRHAWPQDASCLPAWSPLRISGLILICLITYALVRQAMYRVRLQN